MTIAIHPRLMRAVAISYAWPTLLGLVAFVGTLASACATPFVALAVLAAVTMSPRTAWQAVAVIWLINQMLGFIVLGFPHTAQTIAWGGVIGLSAGVALVIARKLTANRAQTPTRLLCALAISFIGYEAGIFAFANVLGLTCPFTPAVIAQIALNDGLWFALLYPLHLVMRKLTPGWFNRTVARGHA